MGIKPLDLSNTEVNGITFLEFSHRHIKPSGKGVRKWKCRCHCGKEFVTIPASVKNGATTSCGCNHRAVSAALGKKKATHGMSKSKEYKIWAHMKQRCYDAKSKEYKYYGARGISVCDRWLTSFPNFIADMGPRPSDKHSIDRVDNNGNYCPDNCKWSTVIEQRRNRRGRRWLTFNGQTRIAAEWSEITGIPRSLIIQRIDKNGYSVEEALTLPIANIGRRCSKNHCP
jgi:hypothetical protein